ncbi:glycosyltransferase family 2 protein [Candidatus Wolfebacteria bacterium]|nr:glycosyltransferase family 2 protein [Candidatus Wolfebacteria bacterium]
MKLPITAIILTYNEEINLPHCLESIKDWVSEILVVDSGSADRTREIAKKYGAKIYERQFKNQADQFNWAVDNVKIKTDWILRLDADERMTEKLWAELAGTLTRTNAGEVTGFYMKRRVYFMGRWIKHGGYYPTWFLRLVRKGAARYEERSVDEHMVLLRGRAQKLEHDFVDENKKDLSWWTKKQNNYSTREAGERLKQVSSIKYQVSGQAGRKRKLKSLYLILPLFGRAFGYFIYRYIFRFGFLDGREGLIFHFLQGCWHQFLIDAKMYENRIRNKEL